MSQEYRYKAQLNLILGNLRYAITLGRILKNSGIIRYTKKV